MPTHHLLRLALFALLLFSSAAHAQLFRAYLSPTGNDGNPCTLPAPCRLLPAALNAVASGGEIWMLDSANYNSATVNINKSVSILAVPGAVGSFVAQNGGPALTITASGLTIALRNVAIGRVTGAPAGTQGVLMTGASTLTIERSIIERTIQEGVRLEGSGTLHLINSTVRFCNAYAIHLRDGAEATISNTHIVNNNGGVLAESTQASQITKVSISDSLISNVALANVRAATTTEGAEAYAFVTRSTIDRSGPNGVGLRAFSDTGGTASVVISSSTVASHPNVWNITGAGSTIVSLGDNHIRDFVNSFGTLTTIALQ